MASYVFDERLTACPEVSDSSDCEYQRGDVMKNILAKNVFRLQGLRILAPAIFSLVAVNLFAQSTGTQQPPSPSTPSSGRPPEVTIFNSASDYEDTMQRSGGDVAKVHQTPDNHDCNAKKRGEIAAAPIPMVNPTLGEGAGFTGMYMINFEPCEPNLRPSVFMAGGMYTNSGSWAFGGGANLVLRRDRFRITVGAGRANLNYPFYGIGSNAGSSGRFIDISQSSTVFLIEPKVRAFGRWYIGPRYHIMSATVGLNPDGSSSSDDDTDKPQLPVDDLTLRTAALGMRIQNDTRDNAFYPRKGGFFDSTLDFYAESFGGRRSYRYLEVSYRKFLAFGSKNVLAAHGSVCAAWGRVPFYDLCLLGHGYDIRGYPVGQYRDRRLLSGQVEFRRELFWRIGGVVFAGAGEVAPSFGDFNGSDIAPGGGAGIRFLLAKRNHVNLRVDYAWGRNSNALYIGIREAF